MTGVGRSVLLAFDFGTHSIGVAAGSRPSGLPMPLPAVAVRRSGPDWMDIETLVREWEPEGFVVGLALNSRGEDTAMSRRARRFGAELGERHNLPVHWIDETLSTEAARGTLRDSRPDRRTRKADIDSTAAALVLESFFRAQQ